MKKTRKTASKPARARAKKMPYTCFRCQKGFPSRLALKRHSRAHLQAIREMTMLEKGHVPIETKLGTEFRGRNKIIVAQS